MKQPRQLTPADRALIVLAIIGGIMFLRVASALFIPMVVAVLLGYAINLTLAKLVSVSGPRRPLAAHPAGVCRPPVRLAWMISLTSNYFGR